MIRRYQFWLRKNCTGFTEADLPWSRIDTFFSWFITVGAVFFLVAIPVLGVLFFLAAVS